MQGTFALPVAMRADAVASSVVAVDRVDGTPLPDITPAMDAALRPDRGRH